MKTLHLYRNIDGEPYDERIYFYDGHVYEILTVKGSNIKPQEGYPILDAQALDFSMEDGVVKVTAKDTEGRENHITVSARSLLNGVKGSDMSEEDSGGVG